MNSSKYKSSAQKIHLEFWQWWEKKGRLLALQKIDIEAEPQKQCKYCSFYNFKNSKNKNDWPVIYKGVCQNNKSPVYAEVVFINYTCNFAQC